VPAGQWARAVERAVTRVESAIVCVAIAVIALIVAANVASRYVLHASIASTEEVARYMLVWLGMVGGAAGFARGGPGGVDILVRSLPPRARTLARWLGEVATLVFFLLLGWFTLSVLAYEWRQDSRSPALRVPLWTVTSALLVGAVFAAVHLVCHWLSGDPEGRA
jgi:TRAP-type C4-dicarboxylate transport system permease small subunit